MYPDHVAIGVEDHAQSSNEEDAEEGSLSLSRKVMIVITQAQPHAVNLVKSLTLICTLDTIAPNMELQGLHKAAWMMAAMMRNGPEMLTIQRG